jgi:uncharacterized membrane protein YkgB
MKTKRWVADNRVYNWMGSLLGVVLLIAGILPLVACESPMYAPGGSEPETIFIPAGTTICGYYFAVDTYITFSEPNVVFVDPPDAPIVPAD